MYAQPDHRFCRRWAVLTDPEETLGASGAGIKVGMGVAILCAKKSINHLKGKYHENLLSLQNPKMFDCRQRQ